MITASMIATATSLVSGLLGLAALYYGFMKVRADTKSVESATPVDAANSAVAVVNSAMDRLSKELQATNDRLEQTRKDLLVERERVDNLEAKVDLYEKISHFSVTLLTGTVEEMLKIVDEFFDTDSAAIVLAERIRRETKHVINMLPDWKPRDRP